MSLIKKIMMWLGIFIGSGLCFLLGLYLIATLLTSGLKTPIEKQLAAIRTEDAALAYSYTSTTFQANTSFEDFKKYINQYSGLRNNASISFDEREISDGVGMVKATLKSRSGAKTPIAYRLIKENDQWKIEGMVINPKGDTQSENDKSATTTRTKSTVNNTPAAPVTLTNYYQDPKYGFSIRYPADWIYSQPAKGAVVFNGKPGTPSYNSSITLQTMARNHRRSVQQVVDEVKMLIARVSSDMQIIDEGPITGLQSSNAGYQARFIVYRYTTNNQLIAQLEVIYYKSPDKALYTFDYTTPASQFDADLPIAKTMVDTFAAG